MISRVALLAILAGCSSPAAPAAPVGAAPGPGPEPVATVAPELADAGPVAAAASTVDAGLAPDAVLLHTEANLDSAAGLETIELLANGTLRAGDLSIKLDAPAPGEYFWDKQAGLRAVALDTAKKQVAIHLGTPTGESEDPPNRNQVFIVKKKRLVRVFDQVVGVYNPTDILFPGDGTLRYVESGWTACERAKHPATPVVKHEVVFRLNRAGTSMVEWKRIDTVDKQDCSQLAACPYVYAVTDAGATRVGEILRDLRGTRAYSLQSLPLPAGTTRVRLAEEKPEVTYLDQIVLEAGGVELRPRACVGHPVPAYCEADHVPFVLHRGESVDLEFDVGAHPPHDLTLFARGYYVPL